MCEPEARWAQCPLCLQYPGALFGCPRLTSAVPWFVQRSVLAQHARSAHSPASYVCDICQKRFGRVSVLSQHRRIHSRVKAFACHCGKAFHQKGEARRCLDTGTRNCGVLLNPCITEQPVSLI